MSTRAWVVLAFGLGMVAGTPAVAIVTTWWYEKFYLPRITGTEDDDQYVPNAALQRAAAQPRRFTHTPKIAGED